MKPRTENKKTVNLNMHIISRNAKCIVMGKSCGEIILTINEDKVVNSKNHNIPKMFNFLPEGV